MPCGPPLPSVDGVILSVLPIRVSADPCPPPLQLDYQPHRIRFDPSRTADGWTKARAESRVPNRSPHFLPSLAGREATAGLALLSK